MTTGVEAMWGDLRYACRSLRQSGGCTAWVVGSLATGISATVAAFAFLVTLLVGPFPGVTAQDRLVRLAAWHDCGTDCRSSLASAADLAAFSDALEGLRGLAGYTFHQVSVSTADVQSMRSVLASAGYFDVLGVSASVGRVFGPADERADASVAVISHRVWSRDFDADPSVLGRFVRVGPELVEIVGVAPEFFVGVDLRTARGDRGPDLWLPLWLADRIVPAGPTKAPMHREGLSFVGRLRDSVSIAGLQAEADVVVRRLAAARGLDGRRATAEVRRVWLNNPEHWPLGFGLIMPVPILVLVIACVNAANLMLARGSQRRREFAVRLAIGATRGRLLRELLVESFVLAVLASAIALPLAWCGLRMGSSPIAIPIAFDTRVLAFTILAAFAATLLAGLPPALRASAEQPASTLSSAAPRGDAVPRQSRRRRAVVAAQVALSLALLATGWQLVATVRSQAVSGGTPGDRLLVARFDLRPLGLQAADVESFYSRLLAGAVRLEGVESAGLARATAIWTFGQRNERAAVRVWPGDTLGEGRLTLGGYAAGDLFGAVGLHVVAGRGFTDADRSRRPRVALANQSFAATLPALGLGQMVRVAPRDGDIDDAIEVEVIGIIEPATEPRLMPGGAPAAKLYLPSPIEPEPALALYLRTASKARRLTQAVTELVSRTDPRVPVGEIGTLDELNERSYGAQLWLARAAAFLGIIGLLLTTAGVYAVSSYAVVLRSREIAIRIAIGATPRRILAMILGQSLRMGAVGLAAGGAAAAAASRIIQAEYHGIQGIDPVAFGGATALFVSTMLLASTFPALRASRVDPIENLKDG